MPKSRKRKTEKSKVDYPASIRILGHKTVLVQNDAELRRELVAWAVEYLATQILGRVRRPRRASNRQIATLLLAYRDEALARLRELGKPDVWRLLPDIQAAERAIGGPEYVQDDASPDGRRWGPHPREWAWAWLAALASTQLVGGSRADRDVHVGKVFDLRGQAESAERAHGQRSRGGKSRAAQAAGWREVVAQAWERLHRGDHVPTAAQVISAVTDPEDDESLRERDPRNVVVIETDHTPYRLAKKTVQNFISTLKHK